MKKMLFTDYNTIRFSDTNYHEHEMNTDAFFAILNYNIDSEDYGVYYDNNQFIVCFDGEEYSVLFDEMLQKNISEDNSNPIYKQLVSLSRIQSMIDTANKNGIISSEILDDDSKKVYLSNLKKHKFSIKKYFNNFGKDLSEAFECAYEKYEKWQDVDVILAAGLTMLGGLAATILCIWSENFIHLLWVLSAFPIIAGKYGLIFVGSLAINRLARLVGAISNSKLRKNKIKCLEKSLRDKNLLVGNIKDETKEIDKQEVKSVIPVMINKLIDLLEGVDPVNRGTLTSEIREFLVEYENMVKDNTKTDRELFLENKSISERIVDLELRINSAKRLNNNRVYEANYLLGRLDSLDTPKEEEVEEPKIYCKIQ